MKKINKRSCGLDLVRFVAIFMVVMVHSFMHSNFNNNQLYGFQMFILLFIRCICHSGVLIFIILTGYLKNKKEPNLKHYGSIKDILITYFIISIISILYKLIFLNQDFSLFNTPASIFNYTAAPYAWYVEMYLGLFFIIPFINILYKNIKTKKQKLVLIITLFLFSSVFPTLTKLNIFGYSLNLFPDWWELLYPLLMYFIGCYFSEYKTKIEKKKLLVYLFITNLLNTLFLFFIAHGGSINSVLISESYTFSVIISVIIFLLLYDLECKNKYINSIISFFSKVSFGTYLISFCFDSYIYSFDFFKTSRYYFLLCTIILTPIIFILSSIASYIVSLVVKYINKIICKIKKKM